MTPIKWLGSWQNPGEGFMDKDWRELGVSILWDWQTLGTDGSGWHRERRRSVVPW